MRSGEEGTLRRNNCSSFANRLFGDLEDNWTHYPQISPLIFFPTRKVWRLTRNRRGERCDIYSYKGFRQIVCFLGTRSRRMPIRLVKNQQPWKNPQFLRDMKAPEGRRFITFSSTPFCASRRPKSLSKILLGYSKSLQAMVPTFLTRAQFPKHPLWSFVGLFWGPSFELSSRKASATKWLALV